MIFGSSDGRGSPLGPTGTGLEPYHWEDCGSKPGSLEALEGLGEFGDTKKPEKAVILPARSGIIHHFTQKKTVEMGEIQETLWVLQRVGHGIT